MTPPLFKISFLFLIISAFALSCSKEDVPEVEEPDSDICDSFTIESNNHKYFFNYEGGRDTLRSSGLVYIHLSMFRDNVSGKTFKADECNFKENVPYTLGNLTIRIETSPGGKGEGLLTIALECKEGLEYGHWVLNIGDHGGSQDINIFQIPEKNVSIYDNL